jgi:hypothetical protein
MSGKGMTPQNGYNRKKWEEGWEWMQKQKKKKRAKQRKEFHAKCDV